MALQKAKMVISTLLVGVITLFKDMIAPLPTHQQLWLQGLSSDPADIFYNQLTDTLAVPIGSNVATFTFSVPLTAQKSDLHEDEISTFIPNPTNGIINLNGLKNESKHICH
jgi:hypothetical protein